MKVEGAIEVHNLEPGVNVGARVFTVSKEGGEIGWERVIHRRPFSDEVNQNLAFDRVPRFEVQVEFSKLDGPLHYSTGTLSVVQYLTKRVRHYDGNPMRLEVMAQFP
jgi:hypothetical protein